MNVDASKEVVKLSDLEVFKTKSFRSVQAEFWMLVVSGLGNIEVVVKTGL